MRCVCWMKTGKNIVLRAAFVVYAVLLLWLLFGQRIMEQWAWPSWEQMRERLNLEPGHTIGSYLWVLRNSAGLQARRAAVINLVGNMVMFVPLGYFLGALFRPFARFFSMLFWSAVLICVIEVLQLVTALGSCDVDDLILNVPGITLGWVIHKLTVKSKK